MDERRSRLCSADGHGAEFVGRQQEVAERGADRRDLLCGRHVGPIVRQSGDETNENRGMQCALAHLSKVAAAH